MRSVSVAISWPRDACACADDRCAVRACSAACEQGPARVDPPGLRRQDCSYVGRSISCLVPGFWDTNTGICAGAMPHRRDFPTTTRI